MELKTNINITLNVALAVNDITFIDRVFGLYISDKLYPHLCKQNNLDF